MNCLLSCYFPYLFQFALCFFLTCWLLFLSNLCFFCFFVCFLHCRIYRNHRDEKYINLDLSTASPLEQNTTVFALRGTEVPSNLSIVSPMRFISVWLDLQRLLASLDRVCAYRFRSVAHRLRLTTLQGNISFFHYVHFKRLLSKLGLPALPVYTHFRHAIGVMWRKHVIAETNYTLRDCCLRSHALHSREVKRQILI